MLRQSILLLTIFLTTLFSTNAQAKNIKPTLLVYGNSVEAFAAAIQASRSNVPTMWVINAQDYIADFNKESTTIYTHDILDGGIWKELSGLLKNSKSIDSTAFGVKYGVSKNEIFKKIDSLVKAEKNITVVFNTAVKKIVLSDNDVEVQLSNKQKLKFRAALDASINQDIRNMLGENNNLIEKPGRISAIYDFDLNAQRTVVTYGNTEDQGVFGYSLSQILARRKSNLFSLDALVQVPLTDDNLSLRMNLGQSLGALAAYCSFFKTTGDKIDVRKLQMELITHKSRLLPLVDVKSDDTNFDALQKIYLTGILKPIQTNAGYVFEGNDSVSIDEVKPIFHQLYSRAQLWFIDNKSTHFTVGELISLVKLVGFKSDEIDKEIKGKWNSVFKFKEAYDLNRKITRYEFAVLFNAYADPFVKAVNQDGKILR